MPTHISMKMAVYLATSSSQMSPEEDNKCTLKKSIHFRSRSPEAWYGIQICSLKFHEDPTKISVYPLYDWGDICINTILLI